MTTPSLSSADSSSAEPTPAATAREAAPNKLARFAWLFVVYLLGVILFGAWVRITHSGAGCGSHWPTCHGEIIPLAPSLETKIEFTHRLTSGLCGLLGIGMVAGAWVKARAGRVFWASVVTLLFIIFEGAVGAGLVLKELVADDDSVARAVVISLHLVNTLILMGAATMTAWWAGGNPLPSWSRATIGRWTRAGLIAGAVALVATSMSGAITALGDTLFPVQAATDGGLTARVNESLSTTNHFLVRLRVIHPFVAVLSAALLGKLAWEVGQDRQRARAQRWAWALGALVGAQTMLGLLNVMLAAPGWLQLGHLLVAQLVWMALVLVGAELLRAE